MIEQINQLEAHAKSQGKSLSEWISEARAMLRVSDQAAKVLGNTELAREWLKKPARGLDGQTPIELIGTEQGCKQVADLLERVEHGVYW